MCRRKRDVCPAVGGVVVVTRTGSVSTSLPVPMVEAAVAVAPSVVPRVTPGEEEAAVPVVASGEEEATKVAAADAAVAVGSTVVGGGEGASSRSEIRTRRQHELLDGSRWQEPGHSVCVGRRQMDVRPQ
jgi:hypothetical protein